MTEQERDQALTICNLAKAELSAFLQVVQECADHFDLNQSVDLWMAVMDANAWPEVRHARYFRSITILSLAELGAHGRLRTTAHPQPVSDLSLIDRYF